MRLNLWSKGLARFGVLTQFGVIFRVIFLLWFCMDVLSVHHIQLSI
jgi:hypothetical protein